MNGCTRLCTSFMLLGTWHKDWIVSGVPSALARVCLDSRPRQPLQTTALRTRHVAEGTWVHLNPKPATFHLSIASVATAS